MGADFTFAMLPLCDIEKKGRKRALKKQIALLSDEDFANAVSEDVITTMIEAGVHENQKALAKIRTKQRNEVYSAVLAAYDQIGSRECTAAYFAEMPYEISLTGGLSWGDPPTTAYTYFNNATYFANVYDLLVQWATEDLQEQRNA